MPGIPRHFFMSILFSILAASLHRSVTEAYSVGRLAEVALKHL